MDREKQIEKMAAIIRRPHYSGNETKVLPFAETYATALVNEGYGDLKQARKEAAEEIFQRLLRWKSAVIFDTESVTVAEKSFENAISALAREEYGVAVDVDDTACVAMICTGNDGKKYVEFEDYERDMHKLGKIIKQLKTDKKQAVEKFAEWVVDLIFTASCIKDSKSTVCATPEELQTRIKEKAESFPG